MDISVIAIGDELLIGQVIDTNSGTIAKEINPYGWKIKNIRIVADNASDIKEAIQSAMNECDVILTTGGLGPTKDDITKQTLCDFFGGTLTYDKAVEANVLEVVAKRGLKINPLTAAQAYVPTSCKVIQNKVGTAPLMWFEKNGKVLVSMPGVPFEMEEMFHTEVFPMLRKHFTKDEVVEHKTFIVIDHSESVLAGKLTDFEENMPDDIHLAYLPKPGIIRLRLTGIGDNKEHIHNEIERLSEQLYSIVGENIICNSDKMPAEILGDILKEKGLTISTAESCTGGNIAHEITSIAGSSEYFKGSIVSYANETKMNLLGVPQETLETDGAVSEPTVIQMSQGVAKAINTDCSIATSGIAGPGGGTKEKPVGTVWIATTLNEKTEAKKYHFAGNRMRVINHASMMAELQMIKMLIRRSLQN